MKPYISIISGTYNRLKVLQGMVVSVRDSIGTGMPYEIVIVDGGSTDGSIDWCKSQNDIVLIEQGELLGAVKAFNAGAYAAQGVYVVLANDDIQFIDESILAAVSFMQDNPGVGVGCFWQDRGNRDWHIEYQPAVVDGKQVNHIYGQVCIVPKWLGDKVGWWGDYLHTYGGDNELSSNILEMGYKVKPVPCACIHDMRIEDQLRKINMKQYHSPAAAARAGKPHNDTTTWGKRWTHRNGTCGPIVRNAPLEENPIKHLIRVLYMPIYEPGHPIQKISKRGLRDAVAEKCLVAEYDYMAHPKQHAIDYTFDLACAFNPDMFLFQLQDASVFTAQTITDLRRQHPKALFVNWNGDYHPANIFSINYMEMMKGFDLVGLVTTSVAEKYDAAGIKWFYWQIGYEVPTGEPLPSVAAHDVVFLANGYSNDRLRLGTILRNLSGVNVGIYGSWHRFPTNGMTLYDFDTGYSLYKTAKLSIGDSQWPDATGFVSNRLFQAMEPGGAMMLHQHFGGMEELLGLKDGVHLVVWHDKKDLARKIKQWLDPENEAERKKISITGAEYVRKHHSFTRRVEELLEELDRRGIVISE